MLNESEGHQSSVDCLIIGAGIAGLLAATVVQQAGVNVRVVDKGRG
ncbi:MAG: NAD(P)-binding protein, partial [Verrucomicrobiaceae bacterium]|nr:NAD(P)-binding protein [Verrucomicrobiaceae bacterium]NCF92717.1 NAD(P)-binding protein [Verrucomicrobiaceae bacterium]